MFATWHGSRPPKFSPPIFSRAGFVGKRGGMGVVGLPIGSIAARPDRLLDELRARDIDLYLRQQARDTSAPCGRMLFGPWPVKVDGKADQSTSVRKPEMAVMSSHSAFFFNRPAPSQMLIPSLIHRSFPPVFPESRADQAMGEFGHDTYFRRQYRKVHGTLKLPNFEATSMKGRYSQPFTRMTECLTTALSTDLVDILHRGYSVAYFIIPGRVRASPRATATLNRRWNRPCKPATIRLIVISR